MLGFVFISVWQVQVIFDELWVQIGVEMWVYIGNIVVFIVCKYFGWVEEVFVGFEGCYVGWQIIGVMDGGGDLKVDVVLIVQLVGLYIEWLMLGVCFEQLQSVILLLLWFVIVNYVWWGVDCWFYGLLLSELIEIVDQVIVDSLIFDIFLVWYYVFVDFGWSCLVSWCEVFV